MSGRLETVTLVTMRADDLSQTDAELNFDKHASTSDNVNCSFNTKPPGYRYCNTVSPLDGTNETRKGFKCFTASHFMCSSCIF